MARGIAFGKRYKEGNMTGAVNAIEKIRIGLSKHPKVASALRAANEETSMSHAKQLAKKIMQNQSKHPIAQLRGEEVEQIEESSAAMEVSSKKKVDEEVEPVTEKYMGFKKVMAAVAAKGARNPAAVAAAIGRKKYGKEKFQAMAAPGKTPETETEVNLAKKSGDPKKITYGDVIKARIQSAKQKALKGE
jgi:type VI protein secretion system component VasK